MQILAINSVKVGTRKLLWLQIFRWSQPWLLRYQRRSLHFIRYVQARQLRFKRLAASLESIRLDSRASRSIFLSDSGRRFSFILKLAQDQVRRSPILRTLAITWPQEGRAKCKDFLAAAQVHGLVRPAYSKALAFANIK